MTQDNTRIIENIREGMRNEPRLQNKEAQELLEQMIQLLSSGYSIDYLISLLEAVNRKGEAVC